MRSIFVALLFAAAPVVAAVRDFPYRNPNGVSIHALLVTPDGDRRGPGVVFMHWGLGDRHTFLDEALLLAQHDVTSLLVEEPFPTSDAAKEENDALLKAVADIRAGVDLLSKHSSVDASRIGFVGLSYGAHIGALLASMEPRIKALVLAGGLASNADAEKKPELAQYDAEKWVAKPHKSAVFLQFARNDEFISRDQASRFIEAANSIYKWYEGSHAFNAAARNDRIAWLAAHLGFGLNDPTYHAISPDPTLKSDLAHLGIVAEMPGMQQIRVRRDIEFKRGMKMDVYFPFGMVESDRIPAILLVAGQSDNPIFQNALRTVRFSTTLAQALAVRAGRIVVVPDIVNEKQRDPAEDLRDVMTYLAAHAGELQVDATQIGILSRSAGYSYSLRAATPPNVKAIAVWYGNLADPKITIPPRDVVTMVVTCEHDFWSSNEAAEKFVAATGAQRIHLPDGDHGFEIWDDLEQSRDAIVRTAMFLREYLPVRRRQAPHRD